MLNKEQIKSTYFGFTDGKPALSKSRIEEVLDKLYRFDGEVMSRKEFVFLRLQNGYKPEIKEDVVYYSRKLDDYTKPKTEYRFVNDDSNSLYTVTKTEYDYANHLINNDFTDDQKALNFIETEKENQRLAAIEEERRVEQEKLEKEKSEQAEVDFENWLKNEALNYNDTEKIELQKQIFMNEVGQYHTRAIELLVLIDNIDKPRCKQEIKSRLHNGNTASKKSFTHITGLSLDTTNKRTQEILDKITKADFQGMIPFKPRQKHDVELETFYIHEFNSELNERAYSEVTAEPLDKYGLKLFIRNFSGKYSISEAKTGLGMASGKTKQAALDELKNAVERYGIDKINSLIDQHIEKHGISPKYINEQNIKTA